MDKIGQVYRVGSWTVKADMEEEFIEVWQKSADWIAENHPGGGEGLLLQISDRSRKFISFAWSTMSEETRELLSRPESQAFMARLQDLCEEIQPNASRVVGYSTGKPEM